MEKRKAAYAVAVGLLGLTAGQASAELLYATNGSTISRFDSGSLASVTPVALAGLQGGETLVGIDVRPASPGTLYGVGSTSRVYTINPLTGVATQVGTAGAFTLDPLATAFGTDFNPVPDLIRQVSNTEQNLRLNPNSGGLQGTDTPLNPAGNIVGVAYDRNFVRPTGDTTPTTLYGIDSAAGTLVTIGAVNGGTGSNSPNAGVVNTVGSLNISTNLSPAIGFDISGQSGIGFASITVGGQSRLYSVNLFTGAATNQGAIGGGTISYLGLAAASAPEPASIGLLGVVGGMLTLRRRRRA